MRLGAMAPCFSSARKVSKPSPESAVERPPAEEPLERPEEPPVIVGIAVNGLELWDLIIVRRSSLANAS
jgi:hypothetical protein